MSAARGSKQMLKIIKEVTYGVTPATPTMIELPVNSFNADVAIGLIRSGQIRTHPFVDRLLKGAQKNDLEMTCEMQDDTHDVMLELLTGDTWTSNVVKMKDALIGATFESAATDLTLFDQYAGTCVRRGEFTFQAAEDALVMSTFGMMAKTGTLDAGVTLASVLTAAPEKDPFVFADASITINGVSRPVSSCTITVERTVDPYYVLGSRVPREYIPSDVTVTGSLTIPYEDSTESARLIGFTNAPLVVVAGDNGAVNSKTFTLPKLKYATMGRRLQGRGIRLQEINWEAHYDSGIASVMSITRTA